MAFSQRKALDLGRKMQQICSFEAWQVAGWVRQLRQVFSREARSSPYLVSKRYPDSAYLTNQALSAIVVSLMLNSPQEILTQLATRIRDRRLSLNLSQRGLAERAGVSLAVLRLFERTGKISLESFVKLALVIDLGDQLVSLFQIADVSPSTTLDQLIHQSKQRRRGRT